MILSYDDDIIHEKKGGWYRQLGFHGVHRDLRLAQLLCALVAQSAHFRLLVFHELSCAGRE